MKNKGKEGSARGGGRGTDWQPGETSSFRKGEHECRVGREWGIERGNIREGISVEGGEGDRRHRGYIAADSRG